MTPEEYDRARWIGFALTESLALMGIAVPVPHHAEVPAGR
jgi:hypothetical protein